MNRPLKIGMYGSFFPPIEQAVEQAVMCETFGLDVVAFTDQMSGNVPNSAFRDLAVARMWTYQHGFYDALMLAALAAQRTERIGITIAAIDTVRNAPTRLAQQILTLDHLSKGRTTTALGVSEAKNLLQYGHPRTGAGQKYTDASRIIRAILDNPGKPIYYDGERYSMKGGVVDLIQYGDQTARIYAACGSSSDNVDLIGV
jgi:phthiodiolone/phenolphthiodiolone dimycocerosates ketoreductase